jgi:hypothetical protein
MIWIMFGVWTAVVSVAVLFILKTHSVSVKPPARPCDYKFDPVVEDQLRILVAGDSHVGSLLPALRLSLGAKYILDPLPLTGISANKFLTSDKQRELLRERASLADGVILAFGAVDCEFIAPLRAGQKGTHKGALEDIQQAAQNYATFLVDFRSLFPVHLWLVLPLPSVVADSNYEAVIKRGFSSVSGEVLAAQLIEHMRMASEGHLRLCDRRLLSLEFSKELTRLVPDTVSILPCLRDLVTRNMVRTDDHHVFPTPAFTQEVAQRIGGAIVRPVRDLSDGQEWIAQHADLLEEEGAWALSNLDTFNLGTVTDFGTELVKGWSVIALLNTTPVTDSSRTFDTREYFDLKHTMPTVSAFLDYMSPVMVGAWLSVFDPGAVMEWHVGYAGVSEHVVRMHVPLSVPEDGSSGVEVEGVVHAHCKGRAWVFDDTSMHRGYNRHAHRHRMILAIDIKRPSSWMPSRGRLPEMEAATLRGISEVRSRFC